MKPDLTETTLTERTVVRRGLIAGLAGLGGAALLKVTGAGGPEHAEAANQPLLYPGAAGDAAVTNTLFNQTTLATNSSYPANASRAIFTVSAVAGPASDFRDAFIGVGGSDDGRGVTGLGHGTGPGINGAGGNAQTLSGAAGNGVAALGGFSNSGMAGHGVMAIGGATNTGMPGIGVFATATGAKGVYGQSTSSDGVHGSSTNGVGLRGTSPNFVGAVGISDFSVGLYGYNVAPNVPALVAENLAANPANRFAARFTGDVWVYGNFVVVGGGKNAAVTMPDGSEAVLYCQESPEPYFEDFGRARLVNGVAHVQLEPEFASIVKRDDYMVYLTPEGELKSPLFIGQKNANGFDVREANGGTSSIPFTYRIVAKRKDIEGKRLARLDPQVKANIAQMRSAAAAKNHPSVKVPPGGNPLVPLEPIPPLPQPPAPRPER